MARLSTLAIAVLIGVALLWPGPARAQPQPLRIAVYAPWAGPSTADQRHALTLAIERGLAETGTTTATVASYAKLKDFRRAISAGSVDLALVDSAVAAALGKQLRIMTSWSSGESWQVAGIPGARLRPRQRLALQAADANASTTVVTKLLRGQAQRSYWSAIVGAPVTADARELVLRGKADIVLLPERLTGDLIALANVGKFAELALATTGRTPIASDTRRIVESVVQSELGGRWGSAGSALPKPVAPTQLIHAPPATDAPSLLDLLAPLPSNLPELDVNDMWMNPNAH